MTHAERIKAIKDRVEAHVKCGCGNPGAHVARYAHSDLTFLLSRLEAAKAVVEAAKDWRDDTEEDCGHHPEWQALSEALSTYEGGENE